MKRSCESSGEIAGMARDHVFYAIRTRGDVIDCVSHAVQSVLSHAYAYESVIGSTPAAALASVAAGAAHGANDVGVDLSKASHGIILGVFCGAQDVRVEICAAMKLAARSVIRTVASVGGDVAAATRGLVAGAIESAMTIDHGVESAMEAVLEGAVTGARLVASDAVDEVWVGLSSAPLDLATGNRGVKGALFERPPASNPKQICQ